MPVPTCYSVVHLSKVNQSMTTRTHRLPPPEACPRRRDKGTQTARDELQAQFALLPPGGVLRLSLGGGDYDFSPLDEIIVSGVVSDIATGRVADRFVVLTDVSPYTRQELEYVLAVRRRPTMAIMLVREDGTGDAIGALGEKARATLEWLRKQGPATATDLSVWAGIGLTAANNRLADLHAMGLARRTAQEPSRGAREYLYESVA